MFPRGQVRSGASLVSGAGHSAASGLARPRSANPRALGQYAQQQQQQQQIGVYRDGGGGGSIEYLNVTGPPTGLDHFASSVASAGYVQGSNGGGLGGGTAGAGLFVGSVGAGGPGVGQRFPSPPRDRGGEGGGEGPGPAGPGGAELPGLEHVELSAEDQVRSGALIKKRAGGGGGR